MSVAVVVPTIPGREVDLDRCLAAYSATAPEVRCYVEHNHPSCGAAWIAGAEKARRDGFRYLHFSADDLEPHDGWLAVAIETVEAGYIPAPLVYHPDGQLESAGLENFGQYTGPHQDWQLVWATTVPFMTRRMWEEIGMLPIHYCSDVWISHAGRKNGWQTAIRTDMRFTHHTAQAGRNYARVPEDTAKFLEAAT